MWSQPPCRLYELSDWCFWVQYCSDCDEWAMGNGQRYEISNVSLVRAIQIAVPLAAEQRPHRRGELIVALVAGGLRSETLLEVLGSLARRG